MTWGRGDRGEEYVSCSSKKVKHFRLEGLLLAVDVHLCGAHEKFLKGKPKGWGTVEVVEIKEEEKLNAKAKSKRTIRNSRI
jgi:hypothetical protein